MRTCASVAVLGSYQAVFDAVQTPARLLLPATRSSETRPSLHPGPDHLSGCSLDPQVHIPGHHLPSDGECATVTLKVVAQDDPNQF